MHKCVIFYMLKSIAWQNDSSKGSQSKLAFEIQMINQQIILIFFCSLTHFIPVPYRLYVSVDVMFLVILIFTKKNLSKPKLASLLSKEVLTIILCMEMILLCRISRMTHTIVLTTRGERE